jgi:glutamate/tyrosine decarboxylase-like PLP-dependent enzyme
VRRLNVPYDCALFYTRSSAIHAAVMGPGGEVPAYLSTSGASIPSPLNTCIENSSRFRALPLYASLVRYGRSGYQDIVRRNIAFAREIEAWLVASPHYEVLTPPSTSSSQGGQFRLLNIVLFAPARTCGVKQFEDAETGGQEMVKSINETGEIYVTGTKWKGRSGARLAVSNHLTGQSDGGAHFKAVVRRLDAIMM